MATTTGPRDGEGGDAARATVERLVREQRRAYDAWQAAGPGAFLGALASYEAASLRLAEARGEAA